ncbi:LURP-one-related/scramblase family protein [Lactococcus termiticola]|uniref:UDP-N-acetylenolpyruvoylglucosamine reductase n=1 Tax=Lactococcus termiticola TaxID=2169526 RepID=A0A2R5HGD0_9LACT|nr:LURP-one-related family protein [Lactococcus termiticola]GBG97123.1 hypothetical protein NtB2_01260 [Lactococcus termiticola]
MSMLEVNGKIFSLAGEFWVEDEAGNEKYRLKGSFLKVPKEFTIYDKDGKARARVVHKLVSLLPKFFLEIDGETVATITKKLSVFKPKYDIDALGIKLVGNIWDMNFEIQRNGQTLGRIDKAWVSIRDKYQIEVMNKADELLVLGLVLAIDYVKKEENLVAID